MPGTATEYMTCRYCFINQPKERFEVCRVVKGKLYRRLKCQKCKQAAQTSRKWELKRWLETYKKNQHCGRCGYKDYRALEFHHLEGTDKEFNVGEMCHQGLAVATITAEIAKCEVLCANCHRIEHYEKG